MKKGEQAVEILGVTKFGNLQISQAANFRNLRKLHTCASPVPVDCFLIHLLVVLYKFSLM